MVLQVLMVLREQMVYQGPKGNQDLQAMQDLREM